MHTYDGLVSVVTRDQRGDSDPVGRARATDSLALDLSVLVDQLASRAVIWMIRPDV
jgi:hypothetical protein